MTVFRANLVFALNAWGEHKVPPTEKLLLANWYYTAAGTFHPAY
jgi:hypothetical protein